ncbi:MAG: DEAD/DEAH box helicase [Prolixibacteraceae bacterium]|nr:DEAD/DEAH box helicase [Prolixibacteraceae bacterium]
MIFIVALTEHRFLGHTFIPYFIEKRKLYSTVLSIARSGDAEKLGYTFSKNELEIMQLAGRYTDAVLASKFSRNRNSIDFFSGATPAFLQENVIPYVEKQMYNIALLLMKSHIPLFKKEANYAHLYDEDRIAVSPDFATQRFSFERSAQGTDYRVKIFQDEKPVKLINRKIIVTTNDPCVMTVSGQLLVFSDMDAKKISAFMTREAIHVSGNIEPKYYSDFVKRMVAHYDVEASGFEILLHKTWERVMLCVEFGLNGSPVCILRFRYGNAEILSGDSCEAIVVFTNNNGNYIFDKHIRDNEGEQVLIRFLASIGLLWRTNGYSLPNLHKMEQSDAVRVMIKWLSENKTDIESKAIEIEQKLDKVYYIGNQKIELDVKQKNDWFDVHIIVQIGEFNFPFIKLRKNIMNDICEFQLPNGEIAILPDEWFEKYKELFLFGKTEGNKLLFRNFHLGLLQNIITGQKSVSELLEKSMNQTGRTSVPTGLKATLRSYQKKGFHWLYASYKNNLGACLADDMGLGKTLQTIALLLKITPPCTLSLPRSDTFGQLLLFEEEPEPTEQQHAASLIVVPTSLVHNWINEFGKFAPSLRIFAYTGTRRSRFGHPKIIARSCDVILTTYGTIRNDVDQFSEIEFHAVVLDESQYIKNHTSKTSSAVAELRAKFRIALTGTPVENSLSDLWSQMNFLNKGLLGHYPFFKKNYQLPIEEYADEKAAAKLHLLIRRFILRRTKSEVAKDLPLLTEQVLYCSMSEKQQSVYEREKSMIRNAVLANIEARGVNNSALVILRGLMRLRQLANHPALVCDVENHGSAKFDEIMDALSNLTAENHKTLIFSSFVTHLELLKAEIEKRGWRYSMLTGKTSNRASVIREFQEDVEIPIFLISLKAGGVGLNLTCADYIFIVDPWWNPAAEEQAISRAHRIGQDKNVFAYRFVTENTIEEKIQKLKEKKSALADKFINSNNPFQAISREEIASLFDD